VLQTTRRPGIFEGCDQLGQGAVVHTASQLGCGDGQVGLADPGRAQQHQVDGFQGPGHQHTSTLILGTAKEVIPVLLPGNREHSTIRPAHLIRRRDVARVDGVFKTPNEPIAHASGSMIHGYGGRNLQLATGMG